jgi:DNA-binding CsgD family transcriptional regulator
MLAAVTPVIRPPSPCAAYLPAALVQLKPLAHKHLSRRHAELFALSSRELEVANLLVSGHTKESISAVLNISPGTVRVHFSSLFRKTRTGRQADLVRVLLTEA